MSGSLPRDTADFLNRDTEIEEITTRLGDEGGRLVWLTGPAGVGKTCLAVRVGHQVGGQFADGVLYAELRGSEPGGSAQVADILRRFLGQLGKKPADIPEHVDDLTADYRALTHDKHVLVILDDPLSAAQVRMLTPSSPRSAMIVTTRKHFDRLVVAGFTEVRVTEFSAETATVLLGQVVNDADWLAAEPAAVATLVDGCGGLPLALRMLGAWLVRRRRRTLVWFAERFAEAPLARLRADDADDDGISVEEIFDLRYDDLDLTMKHAYCLLGVHAVPHVDVASAAAILDLPAEDAADLLDALVDAYLLQPFEPGRYRLHSLVAEHARARAPELAAGLLDAAARRHVVHRRLRAAALSRVLAPRWTVATVDVPPAYAGQDARALAAAELELDEPLYRAAVTLADQLGMDEECAAITEALKPWYYDTDRMDHLIAMLRVAAPAAQRLRDHRVAMRLHNDLGSAYEGADAFTEAVVEFDESRRFAELAGDPLGVASAVEGVGLTLRGLGEHERALACHEDVRRLLSDMPMSASTDVVQRERALVLNHLHIGTELGYLGRHEDGVADLQQARDWFAAEGELINTARAVLALAAVHECRGEFERAAAMTAEAATVFERAGKRSMQAEALVARARLEKARGDEAMARKLLTTAHALLERVGRWRRATVVAGLLAEQP